jgi:hypothetical protein
MVMLFAIPLFSQTSGKISGTVHDEEGGPLPGASIQAGNRTAFSNPDGSFSIDQQPGTYKVMVTLFNFSTFVQENVLVESGKNVNLDVILVPSLSAQIVVTGKNTYSSPSDMSGSLDTLSGIADASSQGVVSGKQLDRKPFLRPGEVAESVPGVIVSQHSGEGKANQYYLRGFNLDHGTDLAISVNDIPVNNPTHGHGQGYADLNFLIPELISAVQYQKGPYDST